jgi:hypothetical protein
VTESQAREEVERKAQVGLEPALDTIEVDAALTNNRRFSAWAAVTAIEYGAHVAPTVRNGRRYRAVQGGTTGATEPVWGTADFLRITDGTVIWEEDGTAGDEWDIRGAVFECLQTRLAKDELVDFSADGRTIHGSQRAERIRGLMRTYQPVGAT